VFADAEGALQKVVGRRFTDRYVFLFDGLLILTKQNLKRISVTGSMADYKLKEKYQIRKVDIIDREDAEGQCYSLLAFSFFFSVFFLLLFFCCCC
jgi:hypothetical protein